MSTHTRHSTLSTSSVSDPIPELSTERPLSERKVNETPPETERKKESPPFFYFESPEDKENFRQNRPYPFVIRGQVGVVFEMRPPMHTPLTESIVQFHLGEYRRPTIESLPRGYRKRLGELSYNLRSAECRLLEKYLRLLREDPKLEIELFLPPGVSPFDPRTPEQVRFREIPGTQGYTVPADGVYIPLVDRLHRRGCFPKSPSGLAIGAASEWCDGHLRWWTGEILSLEEAHVRRQEQKLWHDQLLLKLLRCGVYDLFWYQRT